MMHLALALFLAVTTQTVPAVTPSPIPNVTGNEHVDYWIGVLASHPLQLSRKNAARMLGSIGDREAVPALVAGLKDTNEAVRAEAARALGFLGDERALSPLTDAARDRDGKVRKNAAEAIDRVKAYQEYSRKKREKKSL